LKKNSVFIIVRQTFQRFAKDKCPNHAIIISYFAVLSAIPLVALFTFVSTKLLGNPEIAVRSLNIFSDEFFAERNPLFFERIQFLSKDIANLGWFGLVGSIIGGSFLFSNLIYSINFIFKADLNKSFVYKRLMEYIIMSVVGIFMLISLAITAIWTALTRFIQESPFVANNINPETVALFNNFFLQYAIPFTLTCLVFFSLYKFIPEVKVHTKPALIAALIGGLLWEAFKRVFAFYVAHFSALGIVLSRFLEGTFTSLIFFLLWVSLSLMILLWGAELASVLNERMYKKHA